MSTDRRTFAPIVALALACACAEGRADVVAGESAVPVRGGTLEILSFTDLDHYATTSAYVSNSLWILQLSTRQLFAYPPSADNSIKTQPTPDLARVLPTRENGGISADGLTYVVQLRRGVKWNSATPREVVAGDVVRAFKMLCNPVMPAPPLGLFTSVIGGMSAFCDKFAHVPGTVAAIRDFVNSTPLDGVRADNDSTVVFQLALPSADFVYLLGMLTTSPVPVEYLDYLPDSPDFRQHMLSDGPYQVVRYIPNQEELFERNPVWNAATDSIHLAYVDRVHVTIGVDAQLQQLQIEAGTADLAAENPRGADVGPLLATHDPGLWLAPQGELWGLMNFLAINVIGPDASRVLGNHDVREAIAVATDKAALVQVNSGPSVARPLRQIVGSSIAGFVDGGDQYVTSHDQGDPVAAQRLLARAKFPKDRALRLAYAISGTNPMTAQVLQASYKRAGIDVTLVPLTMGDYYGRLMGDINNARRGEWDLALIGWYPDWFGATNGRDVIPLLYDGRHLASNSPDYGGFDNAVVDSAIDRASHAANATEAAIEWQHVSAMLSKEIAAIPLFETKLPYSRSRRVRNCSWSTVGLNCDLTALWLAPDKHMRQSK